MIEFTIPGKTWFEVHDSQYAMSPEWESLNEAAQLAPHGYGFRVTFACSVEQAEMLYLWIYALTDAAIEQDADVRANLRSLEVIHNALPALGAV